MDTLLIVAVILFFIVSLCIILLTVVFVMIGVYILRLLRGLGEGVNKIKKLVTFIRNLIQKI
jgi:uncharacterized membrane protein